jgi:hypothetical protein
MDLSKKSVDIENLTSEMFLNNTYEYMQQTPKPK